MHMKYYLIQKKEKLMISLEKRVLDKKKEVEIQIWIWMICLINFSVEVDLEEVLKVDNIFNLILEALGEVHLVIHLEEDFNKDINNNLEKKFQTYFRIQVNINITYYNTYFYLDVIKLNLGSVFNFYRR